MTSKGQTVRTWEFPFFVVVCIAEALPTVHIVRSTFQLPYYLSSQKQWTPTK
jgi:hypothetical protein